MRPIPAFRNLIRSALAFTRLLPVFVVLVWPVTGIAATGQFTATIINHVTNTPLSGLRVSAWEVLPNGSETWRAARTTGSDGKARFDLDGLGAGRRYVLKAKPFAHQLTNAQVLTAPGTLHWRVGRLAVKVMNGTTGLPFAGFPVTVREKGADGSYPQVLSAETDSQGWIRVDPAELGKVPLVVQATSPTDGEWKRSAAYMNGGAKTFVVGNRALEPRLVNGVSGQALAGQWVEAWERLDAGRLVYRARRKTDGAGLARFDLDGLGSGRVYVVRTEPYGEQVTSKPINVPGRHRFAVGRLEVALTNGVNGEPYAWREVTLMAVASDGTRSAVRTFNTKADGIARLDPPGLGTERYVLRAASTADGSWKFSQELTGPGRYGFVVGNPALVVRVVDQASNKGLAGLQVSAYEVLPDGSEAWRAARTTDSDGRARFDLDRLGAGRVYLLKTKPYAHQLTSDTLREPGYHYWPVGTLTVTLKNRNNGNPLAGRKLVALEKAPSGALTATRSAVTDANGQVRLDLPGLGDGTHYLMRADNPFGEGKRYFGPLVRSNGAVAFDVRRGDTAQPDLKPPSVAILSPAPFSPVGLHGLRVEGSAADDGRVRDVQVNIESLGGEVLGTASAALTRSTGRWVAEFGPLNAAAPSSVVIVATAKDDGFNSAEARVLVPLIKDETSPRIRVTSHRNGDEVPDGSFVLTGTVEDDTGPAILIATTRDESGRLIDMRPLEIIPGSGHWAYTVFGGEAGTSGVLEVRLSARDKAGNTSARSLLLHQSDRARREWHLLSRVTFGATLELIEELRRDGIAAFIDRQLAPDTIDDSQGQALAKAAEMNDDPASFFLPRAIHSKRQIREVMTWFWENHFNTDRRRHQTPAYEISEHKAFRRHALGRFRDLLGASARSPAMLRYLDGVSNIAGRPNENYARELMELHTVGIGGGYTQTDVEEVARAFTGWTIANDAFKFDASRHDSDPKTVLGHRLPGGRGVRDGQEVLDILARHPATARHICAKLVTLMVSDTPGQAPIQRCAGVFAAAVDAPDQMAQVVREILVTGAFNNPATMRTKVKTPLEHAFGTLRNLGIDADIAALERQLRRMGMPLFIYPVPTGYPETAEYWSTSQSLMTRLHYLDHAVMARGDNFETVPAWRDRFAEQGLESADGIVGRLLELTHGPTFTRADWEQGMAVLTDEGNASFRLSDWDAERRLGRLALTVTALPGYQLQ